MAAAVGCKGYISGFYRTYCAVIVIIAGTGQNIIGFTFIMVLMIAESSARFDYYLGIEPALSVQFLFSKDMFNDHMSFSAAHILDRFYFHHLLPSFHVLFNSFLVFPFLREKDKESS